MAYLLFIISVANSSDMAAQVETNHPDGGNGREARGRKTLALEARKQMTTERYVQTKVKLKSFSVIESTVKHCQAEVLKVHTLKPNWKPS